jgi:hypothetical protein
VEKSSTVDDKETLSFRNGVPADVRAVAYYFYLTSLLGFIMAALGAKTISSWRVFGILPITSSLGDWACMLSSDLSGVFCAWGLMRGVKLAWWFTFLLIVYSLTGGASVFRTYPPTATVIMVINAALLGWLWFRRNLYLHLKSGRSAH